MSTYLGSTPVNVLDVLFRNKKAIALYRGSVPVWSAWSPLDLFKDGKQGVWYAPSDKSTLFQDVAGTIPVTKDGDPVALMRDKSGNGNHATQSVSAARPIYRTDGDLHWLQFDGVDDSIESVHTIGDNESTCTAYQIITSKLGVVSGPNGGANRWYIQERGTTTIRTGAGSIWYDSPVNHLNKPTSHLHSWDSSGNYSAYIHNNLVRNENIGLSRPYDKPFNLGGYGSTYSNIRLYSFLSIGKIIEEENRERLFKYYKFLDL